VDVTVGTFNLNNLFSRFNFQAQVDDIVEDDPDSGLTATYTFNDPERFRLRTYQGRLVHGKNPADQDTIAARIAAMDLDVLCAQEVEDIDTLRFFVAQHLEGRYRFLVLVEGNDPRLIDLAVLSKLPLGAVASWQHAFHPEDPTEPVFSRDLLEVEILHPSTGSRLFTVFNNHLKSQFVPFDQDPVAGKQANDERRRRQAETVERIVAARTRPDSRYVVVGDLNDTPDAPTLAAIAASERLQLVNGLTQPEETRPPKADAPPPPASGAWTHRFKEPGKPAHYALFDQIWLSPALAGRQAGAFIDRRTRHGGDGSDHDPAWVALTL
jgi:endonuclease/exonuclease/phosphatase family metal-dependent hydrolase